MKFGSMKIRWAVVTDIDPLRITYDGSGETELPFTPMSLIDPQLLAVDERVLCLTVLRQPVILGRSGGVSNDFASGDIIWTGASSARAGFLLCDGSAVSRTTYADLFAVIGTTYGAGDGSTTFNVPNLKGRVPVGRDSGQTEFDTLGETGGAKTHTLLTAEMPAHTHTQTGLTVSALLGYGQTSPILGNATNAAGGAVTGSTGGGGAHNNLQPYLVLNGVIKT